MNKPGCDAGRVYARRKNFLCGVAVFAASPFLLFGEASAAAQDGISADAGRSQPIIVTARRREENLQDTPLSITALTSEDLAARSLSSLDQVGNFVPNVSMSSGAGGSGGANNLSIYIRGVGQNDFLFTVDPAVGVYVDGVYYPRSLGSTLDLLDIERVEVLRGPQGTLFGKNTIGGAVSVTSVAPTGDTGGYIEGTYGSYDRIDVRGSVETSLVDDILAARVSFSSRDRDGYGTRRDFFTGEVIDHPGDENQSAARLALRWTPSSAVTVDLTADYSRWRQQSVPEVLLSFDQSVSVVSQLWNAFVANPVPISAAFISADPYTSFGTGPNENTLDSWGVSGVLNWEASDSFSIKSVTAYRHMTASFGRDGDGGPVDYIATLNDQRQHQFSQEIQFLGTAFDDRLNWVIGGFYFDEYGVDTNDVTLASGLFGAFEALPGPIDGSPLAMPTAPGGLGNPINVALDLDFDIYNQIKIESYAVFGQATFNIADSLNMTVGARFSHEQKEYTLAHTRTASGVPIIPLTTVSDSWDSFTPMASLDYRISPSLLVYGSVSRGFKGGGFNGRPTTDNTPPIPFDPEEVTAYEIGFKSDLFDRRLRFNSAFFYNDYTDIQLSRVNANAAGVLVLDLGNAGDAEIFGFEVELQAQPTDRLTLTGSLGYTDFEFTNLAAGVTDITLQTRPPLVPRWTAVAGAAYTIPITNSSNVIVRGDVAYRSQAFLEASNLASLSQSAYALVNARISYENLNSGWEVSVFATNLTDKAYLASGLSALASFGTTEGAYGRPREFGVSARVRF